MNNMSICESESISETIEPKNNICIEHTIKNIIKKKKKMNDTVIDMEVVGESENIDVEIVESEIVESDIEITEQQQPQMTQSDGLRKRISQMVGNGRRMNDDSRGSESTLTEALCELTPYIQEKCNSMGGTLIHKKSISLFECQEYFQRCGGPSPNEENKKVYMKPDGGIFMLNLNGDTIPLLIIEDKVQGTNDSLYEEKKKRQATGNAIERGAKNIRGSEMIFANQDIFPYVLFASGCDFHSSETIAKRIEMMNMGVPNHYIGLSPNTTQEEMDAKLNAILESININKRLGKSVASVFVKAHKYNEMKHGASLWKKEEILLICKKVIDKVFKSLTHF